MVTVIGLEQVARILLALKVSTGLYYSQCLDSLNIFLLLVLDSSKILMTSLELRALKGTWRRNIQNIKSFLEMVVVVGQCVGILSFSQTELSPGF